VVALLSPRPYFFSEHNTFQNLKLDFSAIKCFQNRVGDSDPAHLLLKIIQQGRARAVPLSPHKKTEEEFIIKNNYVHILCKVMFLMIFFVCHPPPPLQFDLMRVITNLLKNLAVTCSN
jgi:hypothetical protein